MKNTKIDTDINMNISCINKYFDKDIDINKRKLYIANEYEAYFICLDRMFQQHVVELGIIQPLVESKGVLISKFDIKDYIKNKLGITDENISSDWNVIISTILDGHGVVLVDQLDVAILLKYKNPPIRAITEPSIETNIRGPREGFTEDCATNICLIRKIIKNVNLKFEEIVVGEQSNTKVIIAYMSNKADLKIVDEVRTAISNIKVDSLANYNIIEKRVMGEKRKTIFPLVCRTEKPDVASSKILGGKVVIIIDGYPSVLTLPCRLVEHFQSMEDYYMHWIPAAVFLVLRYFSAFFSVLLPGLWVAIATLHQGLMPTSLVTSIIVSRIDVPFSIVFETFVMSIAFDLLREGGIRMPAKIGESISMLGAVVIGQTAVNAGFIATPIVLVVSVTAIANYNLPSLELTRVFIVIRYVFLLLGGMFGVIGIFSGIIIFALHLIALKPFGIPYASPITPMQIKQLKETFFKSNQQ